MAQSKKEGTSKANLRATVLKSGNVVASVDAPTGSHGRTRTKEDSMKAAIAARQHELKNSPQSQASVPASCCTAD